MGEAKVMQEIRKNSIPKLYNVIWEHAIVNEANGAIIASLSGQIRFTATDDEAARSICKKQGFIPPGIRDDQVLYCSTVLPEHMIAKEPEVPAEAANEAPITAPEAPPGLKIIVPGDTNGTLQ